MDLNLREFDKRLVITGGAGFIGSNLLIYLVEKYPRYLFVNVDCLTYAGNLANLTSIEKSHSYRFERVDIRDFEALSACFDRFEIDGVINLAAESHVDRSITGPADFVHTNILGTFNLLEISRRIADVRPFRFQQVSTDEVYGSLGDKGYFTEQSRYSPNSPYSASKASADHLVRAYHKTYGLDVVTTNCSNNYGPFQFPEKLIPLMIRNATSDRPLPVYGDGSQVRDWLFVADHCGALDLVFHKGEPGQTYNIGGNNEIKNIELVRLLCRILDERLGGEPREKLITFVKDRPGHDQRYAIDASYVADSLGWKPTHQFADGLGKTIDWYLDNTDWLKLCESGEYRQYYEKNYGNR